MTEPVTEMRSYDLSAVHDRNLRGLISLAISLGWNFGKYGRGFQLRSRVPHIKIGIPANDTIRASAYESWAQRIFRHSDMVATDQLLRQVFLVHRVDDDHQRMIRQAGAINGVKALEEALGVLDKEPLPTAVGKLDYGPSAPKLQSNPAVTHTLQSNPDDQIATSIQKSEQLPLPGTTEPRVVVSEKQHIIKSSDGRPWRRSKRVLDREWSDGTLDFKCRFCEFAGPDSRGVAIHCGYKHQDQLVGGFDEPIESTEPTDVGGEMADMLKQLTEAKAIIAKVRAAIGDGDLPALRQQIVDQGLEIGRLTAENRQLRDSMRALRDLINTEVEQA